MIELLRQPIHEPSGALTIGVWGGWKVKITPMIDSDYLVLAPKKIPGTFDYAWVYPTGDHALRAAYTWDPATEAEPPGYLRRIGTPRTAGETAA